MIRRKGAVRKASAFLLACFLLFPVFPSAEEEAVSWAWPVPSSLRMSRGYYDLHRAIDIKPPDEFRLTTGLDTPVVASRAGRVILVYSGCVSHSSTSSSAHALCSPRIDIDGKPSHEGQKTGGVCNYQLGNAVFIDHGDGTISSYGHLAASRVSAGQTVEKGEIIGWMGSSGLSSGKHLDFAIRVYAGEIVEYIKGTPLNVNPIGEEYAIVDYPSETNGIGGIRYGSISPSPSPPELSGKTALDRYYAAEEDLPVFFSPSKESYSPLSLKKGEVIFLSEYGRDENGVLWAKIGGENATHNEYAGCFLTYDALSPLSEGKYAVHPDLSTTLTLRASPEIANGNRLAALSPGTELDVSAFSGIWARVTVPSLSLSGWVCAGYLLKTTSSGPSPDPGPDEGDDPPSPLYPQNDVNRDFRFDVLDLILLADDPDFDPGYFFPLLIASLGEA